MQIVESFTQWLENHFSFGRKFIISLNSKNPPASFSIVGRVAGLFSVPGYISLANHATLSANKGVLYLKIQKQQKTLFYYCHISLTETLQVAWLQPEKHQATTQSTFRYKHTGYNDHHFTVLRKGRALTATPSM